MEPLASAAVEFPHATRDAVYAVGRGPASELGDRIVRIANGSVLERELGTSAAPSEPIHVPGPDGGWVLSLVHASAERASYVEVLDAADLRPLARVWFEQAIPFTLHGAWR
jgi:carotenoid cleavage dioxygenase-like enzyme